MLSSYCTSLRLKRYVAYLDLALSYTTPEKNSLYRACRKLAGSQHIHAHNRSRQITRALRHGHTATATHTREGKAATYTSTAFSRLDSALRSGSSSSVRSSSSGSFTGGTER